MKSRLELAGKNRPLNHGEVQPGMEGLELKFLAPPSYGSGDEIYEDDMSEEEDEEKENATFSGDSGNSDSSDDDKCDDGKSQNGDNDYDSNDHNGVDDNDSGDNVNEEIRNDNENENDGECSYSDSPSDDDGSTSSDDGNDRNLSSLGKNGVKGSSKTAISKALKTATTPSISHDATTRARDSINQAPTGALLYTTNSLTQKELKQHGLTQLNIQIPGSSLGLKSGSSKQGSSSGPKTVKNEKTKKTRRAENVEEIGIKPQLNLGEKTAHLDITLPDEVEILSLIVYTSSGIRNSLLLPLSTAPFRKLVNLTTPPKRSKTREDWVRIKSKRLFLETPLDHPNRYFI